MSGANLPALSARALDVLRDHWREPGFCVPNATTYPWQWLWDSCFHAVCWAHLGEPDRARTELSNVFAFQDPDGLVPHMTYWHDGQTHAELWGRPDRSTITQPPMYGHAVAELVRLGVDVPDPVVDRARRGLAYLTEHRLVPGAGVAIVHPWESGCDDSPRWDAWCPEGWTAARRRAYKGDLVEVLTHAHGASMQERPFAVVAAGFNALVAFNARELAGVTGDANLAAEAALIGAELDRRWDPAARTWVDEVVGGPAGSARVRTADALLGVLVSEDAVAVDAAFAEVRDPEAFGAAFGPTGVHRAEPSFDPRTYWRGPAWPQLTYLLWVAARRRARADDANWLAARLEAGAVASGFAEYWEPDDGTGFGARPQSWTALAAVVSS